MGEKTKDLDFGFITFEPKEIENILNNLGIKKLRKAKCNSCNEELWIHQIGGIMPDMKGGVIFLCGNPVCFSQYANEYLELGCLEKLVLK